MTSLLRTYNSRAAADRAAERLMAAGVASSDIQVLTAEDIHGSQNSRVGTYDDENVKRERVGTFDDRDAQKQREGTFDDNDAQKQPEGNFDTTDLPDATPQKRTTGTGELLSRAVNAGIPRDMAERELRHLNSGGAVLLLNSRTADSSRLEMLLNQNS